MTGYNALWDKQAAKDSVDHVKSRVDNYTELVNGESSPLPDGTRRTLELTFHKATTMVPPSFTSTDGVGGIGPASQQCTDPLQPTRSTFVDSTRARHSCKL